MSSTEYARRFWIAAQALIPYRYTTPLTLAETYRMEHNLPEPPPDALNHPDFHPACETSSSEDSNSEDTDETSEGSGDDDEKPVPPGPPRSPPPPPAPAVSHATTTASLPPPNHATPGWRNVSTGVPMPPPSPFVAASYVNTSAGLVRLTPTAWEEKSDSESSNDSESSHEYTPTPPPSLVEPATSHTTRSFTPTGCTPTMTHFRMRALAAHAADRLQTMEHGQEDDTVSFWVGVGICSSPEVRQPRASVQPPENPFLAPLHPPSPDSARHGIYFYGYCLGEAEENSTTPCTPSSAAPPTENASSSSEGSNSSSSSQESLTSSEDVSPYDSELEYPPTPPPMLLPSSAEPTPRLILRNPAPKPYLPPILHHLSAAAQDLMSRPCLPVPRAASPHASALMKSLDEEEVERMLPPHPMSVYRNPAVYTRRMRPHPFQYQPERFRPCQAHDKLEFLYLDGTFRTNSYHHNAILHDAEANFLHTANILFRDLEHWPLAYSIKELLHIKFKHHHDVEQLLRQGHLLNYRNYNSTDPESLESRLEEMDIAFPRSPLTPIDEDTFDEDMTQTQEY
ncbi:hypothetical protein C8J57DRAFT_1574533 [Mycena rebaudengoi]|nr:hypothetical protein C8J57DRAFT_1574533 [Mycena rebaudengoi]